MISVYDGDQITAEASWNHFTYQLNNRSVGVVGVAVQECQAHGIPVVPDPGDFAEHVLIDFRGFSRGRMKDESKRLVAYANNRGWLFRAGDPVK